MHPSTDGVVRRLMENLGGRAALLVIVCGTGLIVVVAAALGLPGPVLVGIAAVPFVLGLGRRSIYPLLVGVLVARALVDSSSGKTVVTAVIAVVIIGLGVLVLLGTRGVAAPAGVLVVLLAASAASGAPANGATATYGEALRLTSFISVAVIAAHAPGRISLRTVAHSVQAVAFVPAVVAVYQLATGTGVLLGTSVRANGTLSHPNSAAMLFALANLSTFVMVVHHRRGRWFQLVLLAVFLVAQVATGSIGGIGAMLAMVVLFLLSSAVRRADRVVLTLVALVIGGIVAVFSEVGQSRLDEYANPQAGKVTSLQWRFAAWADVLQAWHRHPLFGNGIGSTLGGTVVPGSIPHNEYVRMLAEIGVFGFVAVLLLGITVARALGRLGRRSTQPVAAGYALAVIVGNAVNALASNTLVYTPSFYLTLFITGSCWRILRQNPIEPSTNDPRHVGRTGTTVPAAVAASPTVYRQG